MSNPWPERYYEVAGNGAEVYESQEDYIISMLQQLFVEMAQVKAMLEKPLYQINVPPPRVDDGFMDALKGGRQEDMGFP